MLKLCSKCRLPEDHDCKFDFMKVERAKLEKDNQKVIGIKVEPM
jgi:predicted nucleic acid binding AN1-type Zn finger protein